MNPITVFFLMILAYSVAILLGVWSVFRLNQRHHEEWEDLAGSFLSPAKFVGWAHTSAHRRLEDPLLSAAVVASRVGLWVAGLCAAAMFLFTYS